jgi:hypothetical protein
MRLLLNLLAVSFSLSVTSVYAEVGHAQVVDGLVFIHRDGTKPIIVTTGIKIESGDEIETGSDSNVLLKMVDDQNIFLQEKTRFKIDNFKYDANNLAESKSFLSLIMGGFRTVSGRIGKLENKANYKVTTKTATVGIRGTEYSAVLCEQNCTVGKDGLNVFVNAGHVVLTNEAGDFDVTVGEGALVSDVRSKMMTLSAADVQTITLPKSVNLRCGN